MKYFNCHTHSYSANAAVTELVNQYPQTFDSTIPQYSIGIHPWHITDAWKSELEKMAEVSRNAQCLAIGECGLDKRTDTPFALQEEVFRAQLLLAAGCRKPVIVHCVAAFSEVMALKKQLNLQVPMIIHGFSKSVELAEQLIGHGFYLSFGKYLLRNAAVQEVFAAMPENRLFLETDTIDEPISLVYETAARCRGITVPALGGMIESNYNDVFVN